MRRVIDTTEFWKLLPPASDDKIGTLEFDGTVSSVETLWRMVLGMAMKDHTWCILYDVNHPARLIDVVERNVYQLLPPPDECAGLMVHAIDRLTRSTGIVGSTFSWLRSLVGDRITRTVWVKYEGAIASWVASWPQKASDGPIVLFRESYPGPDLIRSGVAEASSSSDDVGDLNRNRRE